MHFPGCRVACHSQSVSTSHAAFVIVQKYLGDISCGGNAFFQWREDTLCSEQRELPTELILCFMVFVVLTRDSGHAGLGKGYVYLHRISM